MEKLIYFDPQRDKTLIQGAQNYQGTDALHIFAHGSPHSITIYRNNTKTDYTTSKINGFIEEIIQPSASWQNLLPNQNLIIILHSCRTAAGSDSSNSSTTNPPPLHRQQSSAPPPRCMLNLKHQIPATLTPKNNNSQTPKAQPSQFLTQNLKLTSKPSP